jgi:CRISPR-associated protein Cst2
MPYIIGSIIIHAPASALNNAQSSKEGKQNLTVVKKIVAADGVYPYVSAQAFRHWVREALVPEADWKASPLAKDGAVIRSEGNPVDYYDDDLFGYMVEKPKKKKEGAASAEKEPGGVKRFSPFRTSAFVATSPVRIVRDFGTRIIPDEDPAIHEHEFYRCDLQGFLTIDLDSVGRFCMDRKGLQRQLTDDLLKLADKKLAKRSGWKGAQTVYELPAEERNFFWETFVNDDLR